MMTRRITQLLIGLAMYGISLAMFIRAGLGLDPWDVFHQGLSQKTGLSIGVVVIAVSFLVLLLWIPLRQMPGIGTIASFYMYTVILRRQFFIVSYAFSVRCCLLLATIFKRCGKILTM